MSQAFYAVYCGGVIMDFAGSKIVQLRKKLKLTQQEFADQIGYSRTYLSDIEIDKVGASRRFLEALTKTFGVSLDSLMMSDLGGRVANSLNSIHKFGCANYVYLYAFTDEEIDEAEKELHSFFPESDSLFIDGKDIKSYVHLLAVLTGEKGRGSELFYIFEELCFEKKRTIVIKNYSLSGIKGSDKRCVLRELAKTVYRSNTDLIIIDKPSFLEKHYETLDYYTHRLTYK